MDKSASSKGSYNHYIVPDDTVVTYAMKASMGDYNDYRNYQSIVSRFHGNITENSTKTMNISTTGQNVTKNIKVSTIHQVPNNHQRVGLCGQRKPKSSLLDTNIDPESSISTEKLNNSD